MVGICAGSGTGGRGPDDGDAPVTSAELPRSHEGRQEQGNAVLARPAGRLHSRTAAISAFQPQISPEFLYSAPERIKEPSVEAGQILRR